MADDQDAAAQPDAVIPPPPAGAQPWSAGETVPLAPPLGSTAPPPADPPPHPSAGYPVAPTPQPGFDPAAYPISSVAPAPQRSSSRSIGLVLGVIGGVVALAVIGIAVVVGLLIAPSSPDPIAIPTPVAQPTAPPGADPSEGSDGDTGTESESESGDASDIAAALEAKIDEYKRLRDSGALWQSIPDTEFNRTAVSAFLYFLTDMKVATIWGVDASTASEYRERMAMLEEKLLAQQPLGDDIEITFEEGRVFRYDGETGEGGYFEE
jgi:hypothetical protein